ncbi:MAG: ribosomal RNA small subunit methyltransferase A [Victivallales bacterium]|nr:ribosomal RNA small subunit methyltransferase A [Victivallales bacterium]
MNKSELLALLAKMDIKPSRKLGQNFLLDPNMLDSMVRVADVKQDQRVLEIGPGTGALTERLLAAGADVTAIELDHRLAGYLRERFGNQPNFRLVEADACKVALGEIMGGKPFRCIANLPYSCSSQLLAALVAMENPPEDVFCLLQLEMAERLSACEGTKEYGVLTVRIGFRYSASIVKTIDPKVFFPPPEVTSAYTHLVRRPVQLDNSLIQTASRIAGLAFAQRRKKSRKLLMAEFPAEAVEHAFAACSLPEDTRADDISVAAYAALARELMKASSPNG